MKNLLIGLFICTFFLSACGGTPPLTQPTPASSIDNPTSTPSPLPAATRTLLPSATPTASVTPLPAIPTFTPTFDVSTIVTVTPAPKAECPKEDPEKASSLEFEVFPSGREYVGHPTVDIILNFLNSGGSIEDLKSGLVKVSADFVFQDITNDGAPDFTLISGSAFQIINILYCDKGRYRLFPKDDVESEPLGSDNVQFIIQDLNQNEIPNIVSIGNGRAGLEINILEWNGKTFTNLTELGAWMPGAGADGFQLADLDGNNIPKIVLKGMPNYWYYPGEPLRTQTDTYQWNGKMFSPSRTFSSPQYRFQAIQDGDSLAIQGKYNDARNLYQDAIDSKILDWWSKERFEHNRESDINFTTPSVLAPDTTEYPRLAAYAYYRIMLLHLVQGYESDALTVYNTLQQKFGSDPYARPYVEMASAFWDAYQPAHSVYDGCAAAIQYAAEHPEILTPLGSDYHGSQSHTYVPADVCPFR